MERKGNIKTSARGLVAKRITHQRRRLVDAPSCLGWFYGIEWRSMGMDKNLLRSVCVILTIVLLGVAANSNVYAIDKNNRYFAYGMGQRSCEDYIKFREKRLEALEQQYPRYTKDELYEIVDKIVEHWIAGFLTAHNLYVSDTYDVVGKLTMDDLKARLETNCRANTKEFFAEAMISVVQQLNPQRVKADPGK
jgi:hypothetical protein